MGGPSARAGVPRGVDVAEAAGTERGQRQGSARRNVQNLAVGAHKTGTNGSLGPKPFRLKSIFCTIAPPHLPTNQPTSQIKNCIVTIYIAESSFHNDEMCDSQRDETKQFQMKMFAVNGSQPLKAPKGRVHQIQKAFQWMALSHDE